MPYCSLNDVKDELHLAYTVTNNDNELNNLIQKVDTYVNYRLLHYSPLPLQDAIEAQLADIEARWVAHRYRLRGATPDEQIKYQTILAQIEDEFQKFLDSNFRFHFQGVDYMGDRNQESRNPGWGEGAGMVYP
jgi:hypothetical protein